GGYETTHRRRPNGSHQGGPQPDHARPARGRRAPGGRAERCRSSKPQGMPRRRYRI
ncbi:Uncharacterized protein MSMEG_5081, partial [Arthrobacter sp. DR-2P]